MIHTTEPSTILEDTYEETMVESLDLKDITEMVGEINYNSVKIVLNGNNILSRKDIELPTVLKDE